MSEGRRERSLSSDTGGRIHDSLCPEVWKAAGYATGIVGKWDSGRARRFLPLQRGFDFFYGFANTGIDYYTHEHYGVPSLFGGNERIKEEGHATDLFTREAKRFIDRNHRRPFFLYLPFNAPHDASTFDRKARQAPEKYLALYGGGLDWKTQYKALITQMDDAIGSIMEQVRTLGLAGNTLFVFASDNGGSGGSYNGPLRGGKGVMWEGGLRVPLIVRWPGRVKQGEVTGEFAASLELFPTFLAAAGARPTAGVKLDGHNLLPLLEGRGKSARQEMLWYRTVTNDAAARVGQWKWVSYADREGLYDLAADIGETRDLSKDRPEVLKMVKDRYAAWWREMQASEPRGPFPGLLRGGGGIRPAARTYERFRPFQIRGAMRGTLIEGNQLTDLMIDHDIAVNVVQTCRINRSDSDSFERA